MEGERSRTESAAAKCGVLVAMWKGWEAGVRKERQNIGVMEVRDTKYIKKQNIKIYEFYYLCKEVQYRVQSCL